MIFRMGAPTRLPMAHSRFMVSSPIMKSASLLCPKLSWAKTPVTTPVPWLECLTVISNPIVPQGAILIHPDTLAGKPDALAYRPTDPLPPPAPTTPPPDGAEVREAAERLVHKIDEVNASTAYIGIWDFAAQHGIRYDGPRFVGELDALRAALSRPAAKGGDE